VSDSQWSLVIGLLVVVVMRLLDSLLPKGYMLKWIQKYFVPIDKDKDDDDDDDDTPLSQVSP
jgi:hypothetical protein